MVDDLCIESGRPLDGDDADLCVECLREQDDAIRQKLRPHQPDDRDGKRLAKSKRPKHKPTPEREIPPPPPPRPTRPERDMGGRRPSDRPKYPAGRRGERR